MIICLKQDLTLSRCQVIHYFYKLFNCCAEAKRPSEHDTSNQKVSLSIIFYYFTTKLILSFIKPYHLI